MLPATFIISIKINKIKEGIIEINKILFEETIIIISGELYINFIEGAYN